MTADYYPLLRRAVDKLGRPDEAGRRDVYQRATQALVGQLRAAGSPEGEIDGHVEALQAAVARIEHDLTGRRRTQQTPTPRAPLEHLGRPIARVFEMSRDPVAPTRRRWKNLAVGGAVMVILLASSSAYYLGSRARGRPAPVSQREPAQPAVTPAATGSRTTVVDVAQAPYVLRRQRVFFRTTHPAGTV